MVANVETMFSVREVPWHGIGTIVEKHLTAAKAIKAAGLDWDVQLIPSEYEYNGERREFPGRFITVRSDNGEALGSVGRMYTPLQNKDAFSFMDALVDSDEAKYETAGSLGNGKRVWILMELPDTMMLGGVDAIKKYVLLTNSHDGSTSVTAAGTPVRVVCQNTLNLALDTAPRSWKVRHTTGIEGKLQQARESLDLSFAYMNAFEDEAQALLDGKMSLGAYERFSDTLAQELGLGDRLAEDFKTRTRQIFAEGESVQNIAGTKWAAVNTVSEFFEHIRMAEDERSTDDSILRRAWDPTNQAAKARQMAYALLS